MYPLKHSQIPLSASQLPRPEHSVASVVPRVISYVTVFTCLFTSFTVGDARTRMPKPSAGSNTLAPLTPMPVPSTTEVVVSEVPADVVVEPAHEHLAAIDQRDLRAQAIEDARELHGDIPAALDHHMLGKLVEIERLV